MFIENSLATPQWRPELGFIGVCSSSGIGTAFLPQPLQAAAPLPHPSLASYLAALSRGGCSAPGKSAAANANGHLAGAGGKQRALPGTC